MLFEALRIRQQWTDADRRQKQHLPHVDDDPPRPCRDHRGEDCRDELDHIDGVFAAADEITIYRIIQESLNNVLKHSHAEATDVAVRARDHHVEIEIRDNGQGFVPWVPTDAPHPGGFGLKGIAQRVDMLGATHTIESWPGRGTTLKVHIGVHARKPAEPERPASR